MENPTDASRNDLVTPLAKSKSINTVARKLVLPNGEGGGKKTKTVAAAVASPKMVLRSRTKGQREGDVDGENNGGTRPRRNNTSPEAHNCPECGRIFSDEGKLSRHRKIGHRVPVEILLKNPDKLPSNHDNDAVRAPQLDDDVNVASVNYVEPEVQHNLSLMSASVLRLIQDNELYREENLAKEKANKESESLSVLPPTPSTSCSEGDSIQEGADGGSTTSPGPLPPPRHVQFNMPKNGGSSEGMPPPPPPPVVFQVPQYRCPLCGWSMATKSAYKNHLECHEGKKPFPCPECYWGCETEIQLLEHFSSRHSREPIFRCGGCGKRYQTQRGMNNHKILKHCATPGTAASNSR